MSWLILGVGLALGLFLLLQWFISADPKTVVRGLRWFGLALGVAIVVFVILTGRWSWLWTAGIVAFPWLMRARTLSNLFKTMRGPTPGRTSRIETAYLRMSLDHDSGGMTGEITAGAFAGRALDDLALGDLLTLLREVATADEQSARVLVAYLDRNHPDWRDEAGAADAEGAGEHAGASESAAMSRDEAYRILGLEPGADEAAVKDAHRRLMAQFHPDAGGSSYLAARINQAKDVLLGR
ncbi:MAG: DnaJ domain-containing protein [Rhodospirillaceae bacterium]|jgi:hypothetical protein|nr:DnaJ domain-containing protein [Rhodospirillaceae bacterium]